MRKNVLGNVQKMVNAYMKNRWTWRVEDFDFHGKGERL